MSEQVIVLIAGGYIMIFSFWAGLLVGKALAKRKRDAKGRFTCSKKGKK